MKVQRILAAVLILATCVAAKKVDDPEYSLIWKPSEGQSLDYKWTLDLTAEGDKIQMASDVNLKVAKVETNGDYTVEFRRTGNKLILKGEEKALPDDDKADVQKFNAKGDEIKDDKKKEEDDDPDFLPGFDQVMNLPTPDKPVKKGDKWTHEFKADEAKHLRAAKAEYEVLGLYKKGPFDVVKIGISYKQTTGEHPMHADGSISLELKNFALIELEAALQDAQFDPETIGDAKVRLIRKEASSG